MMDEEKIYFTKGYQVWNALQVARTCISKRRYSTIKKARIFLDSTGRKKNKKTKIIYGCPICGGHHIATKR